MRVLIVDPATDQSIKDVYDGWLGALRRLCDVREYGFGARLSFYQSAVTPDGVRLDESLHVGAAFEGLPTLILEWEPDLTIFVTGRFVEPALLDLIRPYTTTCVLFTESPYEDDAQVAMASHVDMCVVNDPTNLGRFQAVTDARYLHHAYDPARHHPGGAKVGHDLVIVGTGFQDRIDWIETGAFDRFEVGLYGNWWLLAGTDRESWVRQADITAGCDNDKTADLYRRARAGLNIYRRESARPELSAGYAMGPREVEMSACGLWFATEPRGENREILPWLPAVISPADAAERIGWAVDNPESRDRDALRAFGAVESWTFDNNARALLGWFTNMKGA